mgnify:CR=1 FL=1
MIKSPKKKSKFSKVLEKETNTNANTVGKSSENDFIEKKIFDSKKTKLEEDTFEGKTRISNNIDEESSFGIKRQKLTYLQPHDVNEFYIEFPEFINLDYYDYQYFHHKKGKVNSKKTVKKDKSHDNIIIVGFEHKEENVNIRDERAENVGRQINELIHYLIDNNLIELPSMEYFTLNKMLYKHKDYIYSGTIINNIDLDSQKEKTEIRLSQKFKKKNTRKIDKDSIFKQKITSMFIKKVVIKSANQIELLMNELKLYFLISKYNKDFSIFKFLCNLRFFHYDEKNSFLYLFYENDELVSIREIIKEIEDKKYSNLIFKEKLILTAKFINFVILLHSNMILHRDLNIDYFYFKKNHFEKNDIKLGSLKTFDLFNCIQIIPEDIPKDSSLNDYINQKALFASPKYVAPELTIIYPQHGWSGDIWAFSCLLITIFLKYSDFNEEFLTKLFNRIFRGTNYSVEEEEDFPLIRQESKKENAFRMKLKNFAIPNIPKCIPVEIAQIIGMSFYLEPRNRPSIINIVEEFNALFKKNGIDIIKLNNKQINKIDQLIDLCNASYEQCSNEIKKKKNNRWKRCEYHNSIIRNHYCETCDTFCCDKSLTMAHSEHLCEIICQNNEDEDDFNNVDLNNSRNMNLNLRKDEYKDLFFGRTVLKSYLIELEKLEIEKNFKIVQDFRNIFQEDYKSEKKRINDQYNHILDLLDEMEKGELLNLELSKEKFELQNETVFKNSEINERNSISFFEAKPIFFSMLNRFLISFKNDEINSENYHFFKTKLNKFFDYSNELIKSGELLKKNCEDINYNGKYIYTPQIHAEDMLDFLEGIQNQLKTENFHPFDFTDSDKLSINSELVMVIPLTQYIFSYSKNTFKKFKIDFEENDLNLNYFLPGCVTVHLGDNTLIITGGEYKNEPTSHFLILTIDQKILDEKAEMNSAHRFHSMININNNNKNYIFVFGGWESNEVEFMNFENCKKWTSISQLNYQRSDSTAFYFNEKYIYVFGGWDFFNKKCVSEIERYQLFNSENGDNVITNNKWEKIEIKGEKISLNKYNMGIINLINEDDEVSSKILLVGGFDQSYDYSQSIVKLEIYKEEQCVFVHKNIKGLPIGEESSFWYEKEFHVMNNETKDGLIAVNFNCFNNIFVYDFRSCEFKLYTNQLTRGI